MPMVHPHAAAIDVGARNGCGRHGSFARACAQFQNLYGRSVQTSCSVCRMRCRGHRHGIDGRLLDTHLDILHARGFERFLVRRQACAWKANSATRIVGESAQTGLAVWHDTRPPVRELRDSFHQAAEKTDLAQAIDSTFPSMSTIARFSGRTGSGSARQSDPTDQLMALREGLAVRIPSDPPGSPRERRRFHDIRNCRRAP
jgi:hypothetical protein